MASQIPLSRPDEVRRPATSSGRRSTLDVALGAAYLRSAMVDVVFIGAPMAGRGMRAAAHRLADSFAATTVRALPDGAGAS